MGPHVSSLQSLIRYISYAYADMIWMSRSKYIEIVFCLFLDACANTRFSLKCFCPCVLLPIVQG
jgi:hypothetical protein